MSSRSLPKRWFPNVHDVLVRGLPRPPKLFRIRGRILAYDTYGPERGRPCFWCHGSPSGRLEGLLLRELALERGHRFIVPDRPGVGRSERYPDWGMLSFAEDLLHLADHLGFERFSVAGGSGGGPFVLALAARAPDRLETAVSLACAGAFELDDLSARAGWVDRLAAVAVGVPGLLELALTLGLYPLAALPPPAARALGRVFAPPGQGSGLALLLSKTVKESLQGGIAGLAEDTRVLHRPWGFDLESIVTRVTMVNGTRDEFIPVAYADAIAQRIPHVRRVAAEGDSHFQTIFDLERLDRCLREADGSVR